MTTRYRPCVPSSRCVSTAASIPVAWSIDSRWRTWAAPKRRVPSAVLSALRPGCCGWFVPSCAKHSNWTRTACSFTEPKPPAVAQKTDSLTDRALRLMVLPSVSINLNQFTALSDKDDPNRRFTFTPLEALRRVIALNLFDRLAQAHNGYWQGLGCRHLADASGALGAGASATARPPGLHRPSIGRAVERRAGHGPGVGGCADGGGAPALQGERWASVQACELMWPGAGPRLMPILAPCIFIVRRVPMGMPHVMYLPGVQRNFYEYPSFDQLRCALVALINGALFDDLWQCLPLRRRHEVCRAGLDRCRGSWRTVVGRCIGLQRAGGTGRAMGKRTGLRCVDQPQTGVFRHAPACGDERHTLSRLH